MKRELLTMMTALILAALVQAGDLTVVGNLSVGSNLTAKVVTLQGATDLPGPVLDFSQPGLFYRYTLTGDTTWTFTNHVAGRQVWLQIGEDGTGNWQNTWPADVWWAGGRRVNSAMTANSLSVFKLLDNGAQWLAQAEGVDFRTNANFALQFDGSQNYVSVPYDESLDPPLSGDMTVEAWFIVNTPQSWGTICGTACWFLDGWELGVDGDGRVYLLLTGLPDMDFRGAPAVEDPRVTPTPPGYADGHWHHVAATWDQTTWTATIWMDGQFVTNTVGFAADFWAGQCGFYIGYNPGGSWDHFSGVVDAVRLSNNVRYTTDFSTNVPTSFGVDANTVAHWKFDEGAGNTASDSSPHGHTGTLSTPPPAWVTATPAVGGPMNLAQRASGPSRPLASRYQALSASNSLRTAVSLTASGSIGQAQSVLP